MATAESGPTADDAKPQSLLDAYSLRFQDDRLEQEFVSRYFRAIQPVALYTIISFMVFNLAIWLGLLAGHFPTFHIGIEFQVALGTAQCFALMSHICCRGMEPLAAHSRFVRMNELNYYWLSVYFILRHARYCFSSRESCDAPSSPCPDHPAHFSLWGLGLVAFQSFLIPVVTHLLVFTRASKLRILAFALATPAVVFLCWSGWRDDALPWFCALELLVLFGELFGYGCSYALRQIFLREIERQEHLESLVREATAHSVNLEQARRQYLLRNTLRSRHSHQRQHHARESMVPISES